MKIYFKGRDDGIGNRLEELIRLDYFAEKNSYKIIYFWNNTGKYKSNYKILGPIEYPNRFICKNIEITEDLSLFKGKTFDSTNYAVNDSLNLPSFGGGGVVNAKLYDLHLFDRALGTSEVNTLYTNHGQELGGETLYYPLNRKDVLYNPQRVDNMSVTTINNILRPVPETYFSLKVRPDLHTVRVYEPTTAGSYNAAVTYSTDELNITSNV